MARRGRPLVFDRAKQAELCTLVKAGCPIFIAAGHLGVSTRTVRYARTHNPEFDRELDLASASCEVVARREFHGASRRSWKASAWYLERVRPKRFGPKGLPPAFLAAMEERQRDDELREIGDALKATIAAVRSELSAKNQQIVGARESSPPRERP